MLSFASLHLVEVLNISGLVKTIYFFQIERQRQITRLYSGSQGHGDTMEACDDQNLC